MKVLRSFLLSLVAVTMLANSNPAKAMVGVFTLNPVLVVGGLAVGVTGGVVTLFSVTLPENRLTRTGYSLAVAGAFTGLLAGAVGFVAFDGQQDASFAEISATQAKKLGLTVDEMNSYNSEIDEVNALGAHVDAELSSLSKPTLEDSAAIWSSVKSAVAPATYSAMQKISVQAFQ
jgi:hypothetical protein